VTELKNVKAFTNPFSANLLTVFHGQVSVGMSLLLTEKVDKRSKLADAKPRGLKTDSSLDSSGKASRFRGSGWWRGGDGSDDGIGEIIHGGGQARDGSSSGVGLTALGDRWGGGGRAALGAGRHDRLRILEKLVMIKIIKEEQTQAYLPAVIRCIPTLLIVTSVVLVGG
jgi:hypothetical protein